MFVFSINIFKKTFVSQSKIIHLLENVIYLFTYISN